MKKLIVLLVGLAAGAGMYGASAAETAVGTISNSGVTRRTITVQFKVTELASDGTTARLTLEGGTSDDPSTFTDGSSVVASTVTTYKNISWTAPKLHFGSVWVRMRIDQCDADGNVVRTAYSDLLSKTTVDSATYTWQAVDGVWDGDITDRAHWACSEPEDDRLDGPTHASSSAVFPAGRTVCVTLPGDVSIGKLSFGAGAHVSFVHAPEQETATLTVAYFTISAADVLVRLSDGANLYDSSHCEFYPEGGSSRIELSGGSTMRVNYMYFGGGNTIVLDDATLTVAGANFYAGYKSANGRLVFLGNQPKLDLSNANAQIGAYLSDSVIDFDFDIPQGGFKEPPISGKGAKYAFGTPYNASYTGTLRFNVFDTCPAAQVSEPLSQQLLSWGKGFDARVVAGHLPVGVSAAAYDIGQNDATIASVAFDGTSGKVTVTAVPSEEGEVSTGYTTVTGLTAGEARTVFFTAVTNNETRTAASARGWTIYGYDPATHDFTAELRSGTGATCDYVHPNPSVATKLVWNLDVGYRIDGEAVAGGHVEPAAVWVSRGETVTMRAVADEGKAFHHWADMSGERRFSTANAFVVTEPVTLAPIFGKLVTVSPGDNLTTAVSEAGDLGVVRAAAGSYELSEAVALGSVRFEGAGRGDDGTIITPAGTKFRAFTLNDANAYLSGVKVSGFTWETYGKGCGVLIDVNGGTVVDVRVTECGATGFHSRGGGIKADSANALIARCIVDHCFITNAGFNGNDYGAGIDLTAGARAENCLLAFNRCYRFGGGANVESPSVLLNCTLFGNTAWDQGGSVYLSPGSDDMVVNCAMYDAYNVYNYGPGEQEWFFKNNSNGANTNKFVSCACSVPVGETGRTGDPQFRAPNALDLTPLAGSVLLDAGSDKLTPLSLPLDLDGHPRVAGAAVDIGCIEVQTAALGARISTRAAHVGKDVVFTAVPNGLTQAECVWTVKDAKTGATVDSFSGEAVTRTFATPGRYTVALASGGQTTELTNALHIAAMTNYVNTTGSAIPPYDTPEKGTSDVAAAVDETIDGSVVYLTGVGQYTVTREVEIRKGILLESENGPAAAILYGDETTKPRVLSVNNPDAIVRGITITHGIGTQVRCRGAQIGGLGGTVDSCVISNNYDSKFHTAIGGIGLYGDKALVKNTLIADNRIGISNSNASYGGAYVERGLIENCLIVGNYSINEGGGVGVSASGSLVNCTIWGNTSKNKSSGGIYMTADKGTGRIVNCAVFGNIADNGSAEGAPDIAFAKTSAKDAFVNSAVGSIKVNDSCLMPKDFGCTNPAEGDLSLLSTSPLIDKGDSGFVSPDITKDFGGVRNRIIGSAVDIGAFEYDSENFNCSFAIAPLSVLAGTPVRFTAATNGAPSDATYVWTLTGGVGGEIKCYGPEFERTDLPTGWFVVELTASFGGKSWTYARTNELHVAAYTNYVVTAEGATHEPCAPYADWGTAATNLYDAVSEAIDGSVVIVGPGTHRLPRPLVIERGIRIVSADGALKTFLVGGGTDRCVVMNSEGAELKGFSVTGGHCEEWYVGGSGVFIDGQGGTIRDCRVYGNTTHVNHTPGAGITCNGASALVDRCIVTNNVSSGSGNASGAGVCMIKGTLRNSLVAFNRSGSTGGVCVRGNGVVVENCTIVSNVCGNSAWDASSCGGLGVVAGPATIRNTVICQNTDKFSHTAREQDIFIPSSVTGVTINHCAFVGELGTDTVVVGPADRLFHRFDPARGKFDFRLSRDFDCVLRDRGLLLDWMDDSATDVYGNPRVLNRAPDIGACETEPSGLLFLVK